MLSSEITPLMKIEVGAALKTLETTQPVVREGILSYPFGFLGKLDFLADNREVIGAKTMTIPRNSAKDNIETLLRHRGVQGDERRKLDVVLSIINEKTSEAQQKISEAQLMKTKVNAALKTLETTKPVATEGTSSFPHGFLGDLDFLVDNLEAIGAEIITIPGNSVKCNIQTLLRHRGVQGDTRRKLDVVLSIINEKISEAQDRLSN